MDEKEFELKKEFKNWFGKETFCDNCGNVLSEKEEAMFNWFITKLKEEL